MVVDPIGELKDSKSGSENEVREMPKKPFDTTGIVEGFCVVELRKEERENILQAIRQIVKEEISLALERALH